MTGIYVASRTRHAPRWRDLRDGGWPICSTWIDEAGPGETSDFADLWTRCIREASECSALILYREDDEPLNGALVEAGAALAHGKTVFGVGAFKSFSSHPLFKACGLDYALSAAMARHDSDRIAAARAARGEGDNR